jgi:hypothetical protein
LRQLRHSNTTTAELHHLAERVAVAIGLAEDFAGGTGWFRRSGRFSTGYWPVAYFPNEPSLRMLWGYRLICPLHYLNLSFNIWVMKRPTPLDLYIDKKKAEKAAAVRAYEEADQLIERLKIEIAALEQARGAINAAAQKPQRPKEASGFFMTSDSVSETKRGRSLSAPWKRVLAEIGLAGDDGASIDFIAEVCKNEGIKLKRPTLRAQMSNYVSKHGYLARPQKGVFTLTPKGAKVAGVQKEAGTPR